VGGKGSTRWRGHCKMVLVEDCHTLELAPLARAGAFRAGATGIFRWPGSAAAYAVVPGPGGCLQLVLSSRDPRTGRDVRQAIPLEAVPHGSKVRWWARCPLPGCGARCGMLYRPPGAELFGCRQCHRLTYASRQLHARRPSAQRRLRLSFARFWRPLTYQCVEPDPG